MKDWRWIRWNIIKTKETKRTKWSNAYKEGRLNCHIAEYKQTIYWVLKKGAINYKNGVWEEKIIIFFVMIM